MRVLQVVGQVAGGIHRHLEQLLAGLDEHRFIVAGPEEAIGVFATHPRVSGCWELPVGGGPAPWALFEARRALGSRLASPEGRDVDLVHIHGWWAGAALTPVARRYTPVVWTVHNLPPRGVLARFWVTRLIRLRGGMPLHLVAVSESLAGNVLRAWPAARPRLWAVRNGLEPEQLKLLAGLPRGRRDRVRQQWTQAGRSAEASLTQRARSGVPPRAAESPAVELPLPIPVLGFMGRLWGPKGALDAVEALAILVRSGWPAVLEVAGTGPHQAAMLHLARERGVGERIAFLGWQRPADFLARIDLLLHPSRAEGGFPYTIMEAMAAGVPVVAARLPAIEEVAWVGTSFAGAEGQPDQTLLRMARPGDVRDLARVTAECLSDPEGTARRAQAAAAYAYRNLRAEQALEATRRVYRMAMGQAAALAGQEGGPLGPREGLAGSGEQGL